MDDVISLHNDQLVIFWIVYIPIKLQKKINQSNEIEFKNTTNIFQSISYFYLYPEIDDAEY